MSELYVKITDEGRIYFKEEYQRKAYIYGLVCPVSNRVRYIGKSVNPYGRLKTHINDAKHSNLTDKKGKWIKKLLSSNERPSLVILAEVLEEEYQSAECDFIELFSEYSEDLTNSPKAAYSTQTPRVNISHLTKEKQELAKNLIAGLAL